MLFSWIIYVVIVFIFKVRCCISSIICYCILKCRSPSFKFISFFCWMSWLYYNISIMICFFAYFSTIFILKYYCILYIIWCISSSINLRSSYWCNFRIPSLKCICVYFILSFYWSLSCIARNFSVCYFTRLQLCSIFVYKFNCVTS